MNSKQEQHGRDRAVADAIARAVEQLPPIRLHPAEVTAGRLLKHYERWYGRLTGSERDAISTVRAALQRIAEEDAMSTPASPVGECRHCGKPIRRNKQLVWGARARSDPHPWYCDQAPAGREHKHEPAAGSGRSTS